MTARLELVQGDITKQRVDAIVNSAHRHLSGGGGVDGVIHMTAGPRLLRASRKVAPCEPGEAKITRGYRLPARYVIHTVGPRWRGGDHDEARILESAYRSSMRLAMEYRLRSIAFPAISCGVYGFPDEIAARIAVDTVRSHLSEAPRLRRVLFVCYEDEALEAYREALSGQGFGGNQATG